MKQKELLGIIIGIGTIIFILTQFILLAVWYFNIGG